MIEEFRLVFNLYFDIIKAMLIPPFQFLCFRHVITQVVVPPFYGGGRFIALGFILYSVLNDPNALGFEFGLN